MSALITTLLQTTSEITGEQENRSAVRAVDSLILLTHLGVNPLHPVRTVLLIKTSDRATVVEWEYQSV